MAITKRLVKGAALTHTELDGNFTDLDTRVGTLEAAVDSDGQTLSLVGDDLTISGGNTVSLSTLGVGLTSFSATTAAAGTQDLEYDNTTGVFTFTPLDTTAISITKSQISDLGVVLTNITAESIGDLSDVDTTSTPPTAGQVLKWDAPDSKWKPANGSGGGIALTDLSVTTAVASGTPSLAYNNTTGVFTYTPPDLTGYLTSYTETDPVVGAVTGIVKADGAGNISAAVAGTDYSTFDGDYNSLTNLPTIPTAYTNADVDTHLNTSTATANQILSWDGADYAWIAQSSGSYGDSDVATYLNGNLDTSIIPDTNASYDLGSAEYKIRHLFLSDNSLKFTDTSDPLNIVEYSVGRTGTDITFNGSALKSTSSEDVADASTIDITKTNHFVTNATTAILPDGTYMGQKLEFWRSAGAGNVDITVNSAIYMDGGNVATGPGPIVWRLGNANQTLYSCIWNGVAWVLSHGGPGV